MGNSFDFVRKLVEAERYRDYEKEYWGGADVIFATQEKLDSIDGLNRTLRKRLVSEGSNIRLVETEYARGVIWLINTLAPYVDYDYLSKYDYFKQIADCVDSHKDDAKKRQDENEKWLLLEIIQDLEKEKNKWEKSIYGDQMDRINWKEWYYFGVEHNEPFFIKFVALWFYFNHLYSKFPRNKIIIYGNKELWGERAQIAHFCEMHKKQLELNNKRVFDSVFMEVFETGVKNARNGREDVQTKEAIKQKKDLWKRCHALFQTLYQVRCNLFHGDKRFNDPHDIELVRCAGEILEIYLKDLM